MNARKPLANAPSKWLRIAFPITLIIVWFAVAGIGGPYFGKISEVTTNDQASFLPANAESTKLSTELKAFQTESSLPGILVFSNDDATLERSTLLEIQQATSKISELPDVTGGVSPPILSDDEKAAIVVVNADKTVEYKEFVVESKKILDDANLPVDYAISGPLGFLNDLSKAFAGIDGILLGVALGVVFIILLIVYCSPILPFLVLFNSLFALAASILVVYYFAKADIVTINGQVQGILFILVIGAATDYSLLFISRFREELTRHKETYRAIMASLRGSIEPIAAAGGTVVVGLLCLLLSDLNSNKALGPVGAIGIVLAMLSTLTLLPSMLTLIGRKVFWPRIPQFTLIHKKDHTEHQGLWARIAGLVGHHPRRVWIISSLALLLCVVGVMQLKADGVSQSAFVLGTSEARDGQAIIDAHFPGGSGTPTTIIISDTKRDDAVTVIEKDSDVASIAILADNAPSGTLPVGNSAGFSFPGATPKVIDGNVALEVTLVSNADSLDAQATVTRLRDIVHELDNDALVGGVSATQLDTKLAAKHDQFVVIPVILGVITLILMLLLRSILAPLLLLATTVLSFGATLGISALVFNNLFGFPGADPSIILFGFVFLVALGIDYNIFLMTRVREETLKQGTRKGVLLGLIVTGGVITSAGIVLAATFAALAVIPILFLAQLAFIVAFGVLLDTIIVRSLLVPALVHDIGDKVWWPNRLNRK